jgi:hypothetical protein
VAESEKDQKKAEREARERFDHMMEQLREGAYRFASKLRGQSGVILEELVDPEGETVAHLADVEGDAGALALALPLDLITFETWLLGQIGDQEELDLEVPAHHELWFNFGAWIEETLRRRHGGHLLVPSDDPHAMRLGFSKIMLEVAPHVFAERLLRSGSGCGRILVGELERLRQMHEDQKERDGGQALDRFTAQHYVRMHTIPLAQWMALDLRQVHRLWGQAATRDLIKEIRKQGKRLGDANLQVVERVVATLEQADQNKPAAQQTADRGLFEAIAQIIGMRRATAPVAVDIVERMVIPAMHIGIPEAFPPLDEDDIAQLRKGIELFALFVDVIPHKFSAEDEGFLGSIPHERLTSPYGDGKNLEVGKGDWVIIDVTHFKEMLLEFDSKRLLDRYDEFVTYVNQDPKAPRRRDDGRMVAETVARALAEMKACLMAAAKENLAIVFRLLPPPA